jgi:hypothetical protein
MVMEKESPDDSISVGEIIERLKGWFSFLLTQWKLIVLVGILSAASGFLYAYKSKKKYVARLTFALEEKSNGLMGYAAIASQLGFDLGGGSSGAFAGDNLLELMRSRLMIEKTLLTEVTIDGKTDLLLNRYLEHNKIYEKWENDEELKNVRYDARVPRKAFSLKQDSILNAIQARIALQNIRIDRFDKRLNLVMVECKSDDEYFAKYFTEALVANASALFIETKTKKSRNNVMIIEHKIDSVKHRLDQLLYSSATNQDQNLNLVKARTKVPYMQTQIDIQLLTAAYVELSKNYELASFSLLRDEPLVQVIDTPILPLKFEKPGKLTSMIMFGILGGVMIVTFLSVRRIYQQYSTKKEIKKYEE